MLIQIVAAAIATAMVASLSLQIRKLNRIISEKEETILGVRSQSKARATVLGELAEQRYREGWQIGYDRGLHEGHNLGWKEAATAINNRNQSLTGGLGGGVPKC